MPIVIARKVRIKAIRDLQEGREPKNVVRDPKMNRFPIVSTSEVVPADKSWKDYVKTEVESRITSAGVS
jgi:hypothetical protein